MYCKIQNYSKGHAVAVVVAAVVAEAPKVMARAFLNVPTYIFSQGLSLLPSLSIIHDILPYLSGAASFMERVFSCKTHT